MGRPCDVWTSYWCLTHLKMFAPRQRSSRDQSGRWSGLLAELVVPLEEAPPQCGGSMPMEQSELTAERDSEHGSAPRPRPAGTLRLQRLPGDEDVSCFWRHGKTQSIRLLAFGEVRGLEQAPGDPMHLPHVERVFHAALRALGCTGAA